MNVSRVAAVPQQVVRQLLGEVRQPRVRAPVAKAEGDDLAKACVVVVDETLYRSLLVGVFFLFLCTIDSIEYAWARFTAAAQHTHAAGTAIC